MTHAISIVDDMANKNIWDEKNAKPRRTSTVNESVTKRHEAKKLSKTFYLKGTQKFTGILHNHDWLCHLMTIFCMCGNTVNFVRL